MGSSVSLEVQHQWRQTGADSKMKDAGVQQKEESSLITNSVLTFLAGGMWRREPRSSQPEVPEAPWSACLLVSLHSGLLPYLFCFVLPFLG